jgi:hypothetical protein
MTRTLALLGLAACGGGGTNTVKSGTFDTAPEIDEDPPVITHTPITSSQIAGSPVPITATVTDALAGVALVQVLYRLENAVEYTPLELAGAGDEYVVDIPASATTGAGGMFYYLYAEDAEGNFVTDPPGGEGDAWRFGLTD